MAVGCEMTCCEMLYYLWNDAKAKHWIMERGKMYYGGGAGLAEVDRGLAAVRRGEELLMHAYCKQE